MLIYRNDTDEDVKITLQPENREEPPTEITIPAGTDYEIINYYEDAGISAKTGNYRPKFERLKEDIVNGRINTIVALKLDRITRSIFDWGGGELLTFLEDNDAYLDCANDEINTTTANGKMISKLLMSVSQNEIERTSERTKVGPVGVIK